MSNPSKAPKKKKRGKPAPHAPPAPPPAAELPRVGVVEAERALAPVTVPVKHDLALVADPVEHEREDGLALSGIKQSFEAVRSKPARIVEAGLAIAATVKCIHTIYKSLPSEKQEDAMMWFIVALLAVGFYVFNSERALASSNSDGVKRKKALEEANAKLRIAAELSEQLEHERASMAARDKEIAEFWTAEASLKLCIARVRLVPKKDGSACLYVTWIAVNLSPFPVYVSSVVFDWYVNTQGASIQSRKVPKHWQGKGLEIPTHAPPAPLFPPMDDVKHVTTESDGSVGAMIKDRPGAVSVILRAEGCLAVVEGHWHGQKPVKLTIAEHPMAFVEWHEYYPSDLATAQGDATRVKEQLAALRNQVEEFTTNTGIDNLSSAVGIFRLQEQIIAGNDRDLRAKPAHELCDVDLFVDVEIGHGATYHKSEDTERGSVSVKFGLRFRNRSKYKIHVREIKDVKFSVKWADPQWPRSSLSVEDDDDGREYTPIESEWGPIPFITIGKDLASQGDYKDSETFALESPAPKVVYDRPPHLTAQFGVVSVDCTVWLSGDWGPEFKDYGLADSKAIPFTIKDPRSE